MKSDPEDEDRTPTGVELVTFQGSAVMNRVDVDFQGFELHDNQVDHDDAVCGVDLLPTGRGLFNWPSLT